MIQLRTEVVSGGKHSAASLGFGCPQKHFEHMPDHEEGCTSKQQRELPPLILALSSCTPVSSCFELRVWLEIRIGLDCHIHQGNIRHVFRLVHKETSAQVEAYCPTKHRKNPWDVGP